MTDEVCIICDNTLNHYKFDFEEEARYFDCSNCGEYKSNLDFTSKSFEERREKDFYKVFSYINEQNKMFNNFPKIDSKKFEEILDMKAKKIKEKFDLMMIFLSKVKSNRLDEKKLIIESWMKNDNELLLHFERAKELVFIVGSVSRSINGGGGYSFTRLTFRGLEYIESLDNINQNSKNIFIAFNFEDNLREIFNTHLKTSIEKEGFNYVVVNQNNVDHNKSINDEIIVKLKSSRIIIADFTNHRNSVYFEAGFAMGMNIPIIWTCQEGHENDMSFDTRQFPHIIWKDKDDLVKQVINRIKVII